MAFSLPNPSVDQLIVIAASRSAMFAVGCDPWFDFSALIPN